MYFFKVQGEEYKPGLVRVWIPVSTARELERLVGNLGVEDLHNFINKSVSFSVRAVKEGVSKAEEAKPITLTAESYKLLGTYFSNAVSDAHMIQLLLESRHQQ